MPVGTMFQCRNLRSESLEMPVGTFPQWPGPDEAAEVDRVWKTSHVLA